MAQQTKIKVRRDSTGNWTAITPDDGELTYDTVTKELKVGNGTSTFPNLTGLNADTVDGYHSSSFASSDHTHDSIDIDLEIRTTSSNYTYRGFYAEDQTIDVAVSFGDTIILQSDGTWTTTINDTLARIDGDIAIVAEESGIAEDGTGNILKLGYVRYDTWDWTPGSPLYIDDIAGQLTQTIPTDVGIFVRKVGVAVSADVIWFFPDSTVIEITDEDMDFTDYINLDGGISTSTYGGTTAINCGGAS